MDERAETLVKLEDAFGYRHNDKFLLSVTEVIKSFNGDWSEFVGIPYVAAKRIYKRGEKVIEAIAEHNVRGDPLNLLKLPNNPKPLRLLHIRKEELQISKMFYVVYVAKGSHFNRQHVALCCSFMLKINDHVGYAQQWQFGVKRRPRGHSEEQCGGEVRNLIDFLLPQLLARVHFEVQDDACKKLVRNVYNDYTAPLIPLDSYVKGMLEIESKWKGEH